MESLYGERNGTPEKSSLLSDAELALLGRALLGCLENAKLAPLLARHEHGVIIDKPEIVFALLAPEMSSLPQEQMRVLTLNTRHGLLGNHIIYQGTVSQALVRAAEVFRPAVIQQAPAIIVAHNHPSGNPAASAEDRRLTERLGEAGRLLDIAVVDHVIIAGSTYTSCREQGLLQEMYSPPQRLSTDAGGDFSDDFVANGDR